MSTKRRSSLEVLLKRAEPWAAILLSGVIFAYAGLLRRAHWKADEYMVFEFQRTYGWAFLRQWYLGWSPRLISDLLYAAYGEAVLLMHRPLAGTCMSLLWGGLLLTCVLPALQQRSDRSGRLVTGLAIFALCLTGHAISEVFYWPGGGLSYLPTLAGAIWLFWCILDGLPERRWQAMVALVLIAGSSEVGEFLALMICVCIVAWTWRSKAISGVWLAPGTALAVLDLGLVLHGRVGQQPDPLANHAIMQHAGASLVAGMLTLGREIVVPDSEPFEQAGWVWSFIARILVLLAARWSFGGAHAHTRRLLLPFSAALLMASFAMLVSAYYEFGELCCERHDTMRACFITLSFAAAGAWSADWRRPAVSSRLGAFAWVAAILILFVPRVPEIVEDWQTAPHAVAARAQTWASGLGPGSDMTYFNPPEGHITGTDGIPPGRFAKVQKLPAWYAIGILDFFGKKTLTILPPGH